MVLVSALLLLLGCPRPQPPPDWASMPHLPSPESGTYARVRTAPTDPVVAALMGERPWDASLSGAAAGLALAAVRGEGGLSEGEVREAAWRAGYPHPVIAVRGWTVPVESPAPPELTTWLEARQPGEDVGLVRARARRSDVWVALAAFPTLALGSLPRSPEHRLEVPALDATWRLADPVGGLTSGPLAEGLSAPLEASGEWLLEISRGDLVLVLPLYAGVEPPAEPLVPAPRGVAPGDPAAWARSLLDEVRGAFDLPGWTWDPALDAAAATLLEDPGADPEAEALRGGFLAGELVRRECEAPTVEDCVSRWAWEPPLRPLLLAEGAPSAGLAAARAEDGALRVGVLLAR